jgi:hypothetical protein
MSENIPISPFILNFIQKVYIKKKKRLSIIIIIIIIKSIRTGIP